MGEGKLGSPSQVVEKGRLVGFVVKRFFLVCVCITAATLISTGYVSSADAQSKIGDEGYRYEVGDKILLTVPERPSMNRETSRLAGRLPKFLSRARMLSFRGCS